MSETSRSGTQVSEYISQTFLGELWGSSLPEQHAEVERRKKRKTSVTDFSLWKAEPAMDTPSHMGEDRARRRNRRKFQEERDIKAMDLKHE